MRYLITGGGSGGHIYPALSIAEALKDLDPKADLLYVGTANSREADVVPRAGLPFAVISSGRLINLGVAQKLKGGLQALKGVLDAIGHIRRFNPDVVVGTGGFVSGPVLLAARLTGRPVVIQEQNAFPGVTNRIASRWARAVFVPYEEARQHFPKGINLVMIGNPVRPEVGAATREGGRKAFALAETDKVLVIMGGSGGARDFNRAAADAVMLLDEPALRVLHITGERYYEQTKERYGEAENVTVLPYVHNMPEAYAAADAGLFRCGALTLAEIQVRALPSVLIPSPNVTHNHQEWNARTLESRGAAVVVREQSITPIKLSEAIAQVLTDKQKATQISEALAKLAQPEAAKEIAGKIIEIAKETR